jgi:hypothetical protein
VSELNQFIKIIKKQDLQDGDLLLIDPGAGFGMDELEDAFGHESQPMPKVTVLFVHNVNSVKHIKLNHQ